MAKRKGKNTADRLIGTDLADFIWGLAGNDKLFSLGGDDDIYAGSGDDDAQGGAGNDQIFGQHGNDRVSGGTGHDHLDGGVGNDVVSGGRGHDWLSGGVGFDILDGGDGNDVFDGSQGIEEARGGAGTDTVTYAKSNSGVNIFLSTIKQDGHSGAAGNVLVGIENVFGSAFKDVIISRILGRIDGKGGDDELGLSLGGVAIGDKGNDLISIDTTPAVANGGEGDDRIFFSFVGGTANGGDGIDQISIGNGGTANGDDGDDTIVLLNGGGTGNGGLGNDKFESAGNGTYVLRGGAGDDLLKDGDFVTAVTLVHVEVNGGTDTLFGFDQGEDKIVIDGDEFLVGPTIEDGVEFFNAAVPTGPGPQFFYDGLTLNFDADGVGTSFSKMPLVVFQGPSPAALTVNDFAII